MKRAFEVICSETEAAALTQSECYEIVQSVLPMAEQQDRRVHEELAFAFESRTDLRRSETPKRFSVFRNEARTFGDSH